MKTFKLTLLILVLFQSTYSQNDSTRVRQRVDRYEDYFKSVSVDFGAGVFLPQGNLKDYFGIAPMFELKVNFPIDETKAIDGVFQFIVPNQQDDFVFLRTIDTVQAKSTFMFNALARFKKRVHYTEKSQVNIGLGIGVSTVLTNARNPFYSGREDENKYEYISALLLMPGIEWEHEFSGNSLFTFGFDVQYSPYKIEGALREDIGTFALIPKVSYRF